MKKPIVFMFSGQGSQYYQMGKELYIHNPVFRKWMVRLDHIAKEIGGISIIDLLYSEEKRVGEQFKQTLCTHPAIFMVEYAMAQAFLESGIEPDFVLGTSLGEFASVAVAGILEVEEALEAVIRQAQAIETYCSEGGMLAIIHNLSLFQETPLINENSELAFANDDSHFVVSGSTEGLKVIEDYLKSREILTLMLPVSFGFHSSLIDPVADYYLDYLKTKTYQKSNISLISCLDSTKLTQIKDDYLWQVTRRPIKFPETIREMEKEMGENIIYLDLGPGGTLANVTKRNIYSNSQSEVYAVMTPFNQDIKNLAKIQEVLKDRTTTAINDIGKSCRTRQQTTYVFPGQGSQVKGMGGHLFDEFPEITEKADEILGYSIKELCLQNPDRQLGKTQYTQPALYTVNVLSYLKKIKDTGRKPDYLAGHSLGEYSALYAAGAFDFSTGLKLVQMRGELMSKETGGGMAAVLGLKEKKVEEILRENCFETIEIANYNTPSQIVLSGPREDIEKVAYLFEATGAMYIPLNVSGAFHSRYMLGAKKRFAEYINQFRFSELKIPVVSNYHARPYNLGHVKENLVEQITNSVKWTESIRYLMGRGNMVFEEIGPGDVLTKLIDKIQQQAEPLMAIDEGVIAERED